MIKIFPVRNQVSQRDQQQSRLMILAALLLIAYAGLLTLAPSVRYHSTTQPLTFQHWFGVVVWLIVFALLHRQIAKKIPNRDPFLLPIVALLTGIGLMMIWRLYPSMGLRQTIWLAVAGLLVWLGLQFPEYLTYLHRYKYIWLVLGLLLTALTFLFGENPSGDGPTLWLQVFGVHFQPSEPLKLLLIVYLAGYFTDRMSSRFRGLQALLPTLVVIGVALALLISQKDMGTAIIFLFIYLAMLYTINGNRWILWAAPAVLLVAAVSGYFLVDIVNLRLTAWLNPFGDPQGSSYQVIQSMIAVAEGGLIGAGPGLGSPGLIPVSVSDFIFSAIAEETGLLGALVVILLFVFLVHRSTRIAVRAKSPFQRYLAIGIAIYFGIQSILIIGGNLGLLPLTGVTLPFVSYGGSSLLISFAALLILLSISAETSEEVTEQPARHPQLTVVSSLLVGVLLLEIVVTSLFSFWFRSELVDRAENPRWIVADRFVQRGDILDRDGSLLVTSTGKTGDLTRTTNYVELSPILGYTSPIYGQTGIESTLYAYLRGLEGYPESTILTQDLIYNQPPEGLNVRLTLDLDYQFTADDALGDSVGSAILMNAETGEILAMASHPYFDPATLEEDWEELVNDVNAPLVNRATQGVYPVGAALFPFVLTTQMDTITPSPSPEALLTDIQGNLDCAKTSAEDLTWQALAVHGCQEAQAELSELIGVEGMTALIQALGLTTEPALHLPVAAIDPLQSGNTDLTASPLQMALAASALTNEGTLPAPRIVNGYQDPEGNWVTLPKLGVSSQALDPETARETTTLLKVMGMSHWQVTATTLTEEDKPITWFIAGTTADWQGRPWVVVVLLEEADPQKAESIGVSLLNQALVGAGLTEGD